MDRIGFSVHGSYTYTDTVSPFSRLELSLTPTLYQSQFPVNRLTLDFREFAQWIRFIFIFGAYKDSLPPTHKSEEPILMGLLTRIIQKSPESLFHLNKRTSITLENNSSNRTRFNNNEIQGSGVARTHETLETRSCNEIR